MKKRKVWVRMDIKSVTDAVEIVKAAAEHLFETFNDDDSIKKIWVGDVHYGVELKRE